MGQQVVGFPGQDVRDGGLLVAGLGNEPQHGGTLGKGPVALADAQALADLSEHVLGVGLVEDGKAVREAGRGMMEKEDLPIDG